MKIASFNVNSIRARIDIVAEWLKENKPDVLCVQETKVRDSEFPAQVFDAIPYHYNFKGEKSYNGVAIFSLSQPEDVKFGLDGDPLDQARLIKAKINGVNIVNTYIPQGFEIDTVQFQYKLDWFRQLRKYFEENFKPSDPVVWVGDFNVAPTEIDVFDPQRKLNHVCFCQEVRQALQEVMDWGFVDVFRMHCTEPEQYTYWDYRSVTSVKRNRGWRLDHIMATKPMAQKSTNCHIDKAPRLKKRPSDHTPIIAEFDLK